MRLSKIAILALKGLDRGVKDRIAEATGVSTTTVYNWITDNKVNGDLTKASVIQIIEDETGLAQEQIIEEEDELTKLAS